MAVVEPSALRAELRAAARGVREKAGFWVFIVQTRQVSSASEARPIVRALRDGADTPTPPHR